MGSINLKRTSRRWKGKGTVRGRGENLCGEEKRGTVRDDAWTEISEQPSRGGADRGGGKEEPIASSTSFALLTNPEKDRF